MQNQIQQEWEAFSRTYEQLRQRHKESGQKVNSFWETSEAVALLRQRKEIEAQLGKISEATQACDEIYKDLTRFSNLHDIVPEHNRSMQQLDGTVVFAEMHGLTPESPTPRAKSLRNKIKKKFKEGNRLTKEAERINHRFLNGYYNSRADGAAEVLKPFYEQFSWFSRLIVICGFWWKGKLAIEDNEHLSWQNNKFLMRAHCMRLWLAKWTDKLQQDLESVRKQWQQLRDSLEKQQEEVAQALKRHAQEEVLWARRDPERLTKYLESERADRSKVSDCFASSITNAPIVTEPETEAISIPRRRRKKSPVHNFVKQDPGGPCWKLFISDDRLKRQIELPDFAGENFVTFLAKAFSMIGCRADAQDVAKSLRKIVSYTSESLRRHKRVSYGEPKGWRIFRCGRFRIIMDITEVPQSNLVHGVFIVRYRADAYPQ